MGALGQITKGVLEKSRAEDSPSLEEICKAGKPVGLDRQDIIRLYKGRKAAKIRSFVSKHLFLFVLVAAAAYLAFLITVSARPPAEPSNTYPAGTRYGAISIRGFKKSKFHWKDELTRD